MSGSESLETFREGPIGWLIVRRPESRGALTRDMWLALPWKLSSLTENPEIRLVVIRGTDGNFVAGSDIGEFKLRLAPPRRSAGRLSREEIDSLAAECCESDDYAEGIAAFLAKRAPEFRGR